MKKLLAIFLLLIPIHAYSLEVSGVDGGGNADTLEGQNASFYLDLGNSTGTMPVSSFGNISATTLSTSGSIRSGSTLFVSGTAALETISPFVADADIVFKLRNDIYDFSFKDNSSAEVLTIESNGKTTTTGLAVAFSNISSENSPVTVATSDYSFDCNATDSDVTFNLMSSSTVTGQGFEFTKTDAGGNECFVNAKGSETISGFGNYSGLNVQWESILIRSNGTDWTIKASF